MTALLKTKADMDAGEATMPIAWFAKLHTCYVFRIFTVYCLAVVQTKSTLIPVSPECLSIYTSGRHFRNMIMQRVAWLRFGRFATRWRGVSE